MKYKGFSKKFTPNDISVLSTLVYGPASWSRLMQVTKLSSSSLSDSKNRLISEKILEINTLGRKKFFQIRARRRNEIAFAFLQTIILSRSLFSFADTDHKVAFISAPYEMSKAFWKGIKDVASRNNLPKNPQDKALMKLLDAIVEFLHVFGMNYPIDITILTEPKGKTDFTQNYFDLIGLGAQTKPEDMKPPSGVYIRYPR